MSARTYTVYILTNQYRTVFYTGMTNDLTRQVREHRSGRGSRFAARYRVTDLIYTETYPTPRASGNRSFGTSCISTCAIATCRSAMRSALPGRWRPT